MAVPRVSSLSRSNGIAQTPSRTEPPLTRHTSQAPSHAVSQHTPPEHVQALVEAVHAHSLGAHAA